MSNSRNVETEDICIADHRLHFFNVFAHLSHSVTIESQLVQRFEHMRMYEIALKADVIVMPDKIRFAGEHLHQKVVASVSGVHVEIDLRIHSNGFYYLFTICM